MKNKKIILPIFFAVFVLLPFVEFAFGQNSDIKEQSKHLSDVKKSIRQKQLEKDRLMLQEKTFRRELGFLNSAIEKAEKKLEKILSDIKIAEKNLSQASLVYNKAFEKQNSWNQTMLDEIDLYNKMTFLVSYEDDPLEYKIRQEALKYKKENFKKEKEVIDISVLDIKKWEKAKKELLSLREQENSLAKERKQLIKEKNALLKSTSGRRTEAENEIKTLNESAKALQSLINKLAAANQKKQTEIVIRTPAPAAQRKKMLPWPVDGKVIVKFGKNKHPELDTYVISNGIKIKAANSAQVKSIDSGTVVFTGEFRSYGKVVIIDQKDSYFTVYGQLDKILVKEDQKVSRGTVLASLGKGDESILYFEIRRDNVPDNPLLWLQTK